MKFQRVSSEDHRTPVRGQTVKQSAEMRSALEFFATPQSFRELLLIHFDMLEEELGSEVVFWCVAHVHDHTPLPLPLRRY